LFSLVSVLTFVFAGYYWNIRCQCFTNIFYFNLTCTCRLSPRCIIVNNLYTSLNNYSTMYIYCGLL